jgi:hypothetical protein
MRLLNVDTLQFTDYFGTTPPPYAIASHRWTEGTEATWEDVQDGKNPDKPGHHKIQGFVRYIQRHLPLIKWLWIDTCCIKKSSDAELSEAINSMFRWYRDAEICLAYLEDVPTTSDMNVFKQSVWFRRGWTLQELLAPSTVIFLPRDWELIGHKGRSGCGRNGVSMQTGPSLEGHISSVTAIPPTVVHDYRKGESLPAQEKIQWVTGRETKRGEDLSYCLLGLTGVSMNIRYGDGKEETRERLLRKIAKRNTAPGRHATTLRPQRIAGPSKMQELAPRSVACPKCCKTFDNQTKLDQHRRDLHGSVFPNDCPFCKRSFSTSAARNQHAQGCKARK